ncbi:MAG: hypothetical protein RLZZ299_1571 [Pseudomonadota bacterium]|jgi:hypothetical protein
MDPGYAAEWARAFALTLSLELPVAAWMLRHGPSPGRRLSLAVLASSLTHPLLWFAWHPHVHPWGLAVVTGEALVVAAEALVYRTATDARTAWRTSLAANAVSLGVGWPLRAALQTAGLWG